MKENPPRFVPVNSILYFGSDEGKKENLMSLHGLSSREDHPLHISLLFP